MLDFVFMLAVSVLVSLAILSVVFVKGALGIWTAIFIIYLCLSGILTDIIRSIGG